MTLMIAAQEDLPSCRESSAAANSHSPTSELEQRADRTPRHVSARRDEWLESMPSRTGEPKTFSTSEDHVFSGFEWDLTPNTLSREPHTSNISQSEPQSSLQVSLNNTNLHISPTQPPSPPTHARRRALVARTEASPSRSRSPPLVTHLANAAISLTPQTQTILATETQARVARVVRPCKSPGCGCCRLVIANCK